MFRSLRGVERLEESVQLRGCCGRMSAYKGVIDKIQAACCVLAKVPATLKGKIFLCDAMTSR